VKIQVEAAVMSVREIPDGATARVNLRWEGKHQISDFEVDKLGRVLDSEDETEHSGWAIVERPVQASVGETIPLRREAHL
jgi:hypothetical protein